MIMKLYMKLYIGCTAVQHSNDVEVNAAVGGFCDAKDFVEDKLHDYD